MQFVLKIIVLILSVVFMQGCITNAVIDEAIKHKQDEIYSVESAYQTDSNIILCLRGYIATANNDSDPDATQMRYAYILPISEHRKVSANFDTGTNTNVKYYSSHSELVHMVISRQRVKHQCDTAKEKSVVPVIKLDTQKNLAKQLENIPPKTLVTLYNKDEKIVLLAYIGQFEIACGKRIVIISADDEVSTNYALLAIMPLAVAADIVLIAGVIYAAGYHSNGYINLNIPASGNHWQSVDNYRIEDFPDDEASDLPQCVS